MLHWPDALRTFERAESSYYLNMSWSMEVQKILRCYLLRLLKDCKTVYSASIQYFVTKIQKANEIDLFVFERRFMRVQGTKLFYLEQQQLKKGLAVFSSEKIRGLQEMDKIK